VLDRAGQAHPDPRRDHRDERRVVEDEPLAQRRRATQLVLLPDDEDLDLGLPTETVRTVGTARGRRLAAGRAVQARVQEPGPRRPPEGGRR
jgi:hypothetical protein